jgi:hypothetical protein
MKYTGHIISVLLLIGFLSSCEKVIGVRVNDAAKKWVIEGVITDQPGGCQVLITQTKSFSDDNSFAGISGAKVTITDEAGVVTNLTENRDGIYKSNLIGLEGRNYILNANINGAVFTATSKMPKVVPLDSVYITDLSFLKENSKWVNVVYTDPVGLGSSYRFVEYINGVKSKGIYIINDDLADGRLTTNTLFSRVNSEITKGDTINVEMHCIDAPLYKYWFSLSQSATGETETAAPSNPVTNITGDALGYFSAHTVRSKTVIAK